MAFSASCVTTVPMTAESHEKFLKISWPVWQNSLITGLYVTVLAGDGCTVFDNTGKSIVFSDSSFRIWEIKAKHTNLGAESVYGFAGPVFYGGTPEDTVESVKPHRFSNCKIVIFTERWKNGTMNSGVVEYGQVKYSGSSEIALPPPPKPKQHRKKHANPPASNSGEGKADYSEGNPNLVQCNACKGTGEKESYSLGERAKCTYDSSLGEKDRDAHCSGGQASGYFKHVCPICKGKGKVTPEINERYGY